MSLPDLSQAEYLVKFNEFLEGKNYIDGYVRYPLL